MNLKFRENLVPIVCLLSSFLGMVLIYFAAINIQPKELRLGEITPDLLGKTVTSTGKIIYRNSHPAGHIFLTISDGDNKIQVPLFSGFVNGLEDSGTSTDNFKKGRTVSVTGLVSEYNGELQIIPRKYEDIVILDDSYDT